MEEQWRPIKGFEGFYSASNLGRVRSECRVIFGDKKTQSVKQRIMSPGRKASGHLSVMLYGPNVRRIHVHRAVAFAFLGDPPSPAHEVAHNDGNPANNAVTNLRWATRSENHRDKVRHGTHNRGERHPLSKLTDAQAEEIRASTLLCKQIAAKYGISFQHAWAVKAGVSRKHHEG